MRLLTITLAMAVAADSAPAQDRAFYFGGNSDASTHYELKPADARMTYLRVTFPEDEGGKSVPVVIVGRFYPDGNLHTVSGVCTRIKTGRDCRLKDSWKTHMTVSHQAETVTIRFAGTTQMLEMLNTGSKSRSLYDSDFYYHDIAGTYRLEHVRTPTSR